MERYSRQLLALGLELQEKISSLKVAVIGCGALGSALAEMLTRLGVKELVLVDADVVELSNLHRTHIFTEKDLMRPKALVCKEYLKKVNSNIKIDTILDILDSKNAEEIVKGNDIVFDALDNVNYRLVLNDACVKNNIPLIYAGVTGEYASAKIIIPGKTSCLSCFLEPIDERNACEIIGTTIATIDIITSIQIQLLINYLRGRYEDEMIYIDMEDLRLEKIKMKRNSNCEACSLHQYKYLKSKFYTCGMLRSEKSGKNIFRSSEVEIYKDSEGTIICYDEKCFKKKEA
uniref:Thiamine biosynthesis protein ThiF n=1 Tax=Acidianus brierleyi TaxID=41673 RepID=A0A2U9IG01_9CREN